ncbi:ubiquitin-conjugating enzyme [Colletotrichum orchidophilum]|uniref:Ubiquitin-conjugating enzyme n=1 Tax=Colletotrichum orchidophilum TaxID=1209926 RepID=A0A1G4AYV7_9PEZI|nr:ubiquitin-conjugating enzyme [Colletotrichum orchidophilum]OHE94349.1 ubiquitin-conjugating enzyme [Colletotrichum orchidophilum]
MGSMPSLRRQHLLAEFAGLKQACPEGVFVSLTPGDPMLWSGVMFVRHGPYATAILRFQISFPDTYPRLPPLVTFSTDIFHPLITPLTTYMYTTDIQDNGTVSATDAERLPPGGFSLRHGFPAWFGRGSRSNAGSRQVSGQQQPPATPARGGGPSSTTSTPGSKATPLGGRPGYLDTSRREVSTYEVLRYIRSTFDDEKVLDSVPLEAAGNPGAWHAWRTRQRQAGKSFSGDLEPQGKKEQEGDKAIEAGESVQEKKEEEGEEKEEATPAPLPERKPSTSGSVHSIVRKPIGSAPSVSRKPGEWNWEGVWEDRVQKGIAASLSEAVLYGATSGGGDDLINFLAMEEGDVDSVRENLLPCMFVSSAAAGMQTCLLLIVLATVIPMLIIAVLLSCFICRNFRDAAGAIEPKPPRRWFGLRRVKSSDSTITSLATRTQNYADSWQDLESLRTYRDTPTPSIQHGIHEQAGFASFPSSDMEFLANEEKDGSGRSAPEVPRPLKVLKRLGRGSGGGRRGGSDGVRRLSAETNKSLDGLPGPLDEPLVVRKKRGNYAIGQIPGSVGVGQEQSSPGGQTQSYNSSEENAMSDVSLVLVPRISITPEVKALDGGTTTFWVAIEVSGQLCRPLNGSACAAISSRDDSTLADGNDNQPSAGVLRYLYILEIIQDEPKQTSDELIDDLEYQLGSSNLEYIRVLVKYNHSAFFCKSRSGIIDNMTEAGTRLETFATAAIKRHNHRSPWSPSRALTYNPIMSIVYGSWELQRARNAMYRMSARPSTPPRLVEVLSRMDLSEEDKPMAIQTPPVVPRRETSLGKDAIVRQPEALYKGWSPGHRRTSAVDWDRPRAGQGPGVLRSLASSIAGTGGDGHPAEKKGACGGDSLRSQGRKPSNRWGWTSWW